MKNRKFANPPNSVDISSISSSTTDYAEKHCLDEDVVCNPLERIMHAKHQVIRRAREQIIKLGNSDHPTILQNYTIDSRMPKFSSNATETQSYESTKRLGNSVVFDLDQQRSICEKICREDDTFVRCDPNESPVRDKDKYRFSGEISSRPTDTRPSETYPEDGRSTSAHIESNSACEYGHSPCQLERDGLSPNTLNHSLINRQFTRKTNKFFVPFINENDRDLSKTTFGDTVNCGRKLTLPKTDERASEMGTKSEQKSLSARSELASITPKQRLEQTVPSARLPLIHSTPTNAQPSVKTFLENPILKHPTGSSMLPIVTQRTSDHLLAPRSTNTSPVTRQTRSTNTSHLEDSVGLRSHKSVEVEGKDAKASQNFPSPFYVIQPLLFVLAMFTVSMSGAYVGVLVASAACGTGSNMECEPSILQWLFSSRRQVRAF